jgi:hypothetical protein
MQINEQEKSELRALAESESMRADSERLRATRPNPFVVDGKVDCDRVLEFLTEYNEFMNHPMKPHWVFIEKNMKL